MRENVVLLKIEGISSRGVELSSYIMETRVLNNFNMIIPTVNLNSIFSNFNKLKMNISMFVFDKMDDLEEFLNLNKKEQQKKMTMISHGMILSKFDSKTLKDETFIYSENNPDDKLDYNELLKEHQNKFIYIELMELTE